MDPSRILLIHTHVFRSEVVENAAVEIFKLAEMPRGKTYVTGEFVDRLRRSSLVGLDFRQVWPHRLTLGER